jgi:hypothetical protein
MQYHRDACRISNGMPHAAPIVRVRVEQNAYDSVLDPAKLLKCHFLSVCVVSHIHAY